MEQTDASSFSLRVLTRNPLPTTATTSSSASNPQILPAQNPSFLASSSSSTSTPSPSSLDGVAVLGFLGSRPTTDVTHLINRILDANIFGSGNLDKDLLIFRRHRISYYYEAEKGMVFLNLSSSSSSSSLPLSLLSSSQSDAHDVGSASVPEECEPDQLRGMLFMFSVCHVIIFLHEGLHFDTQILKKFRTLQAAKHALALFVRSKITPMLGPKSSPSLSQPSAQRACSVSLSGRRGGITNRHSSSISLMSGSGSHPSVLPGQCMPVILFVMMISLMG